MRKGQALWELHSLHAFRSMGLSLGHFLGGVFSKGACSAVLVKGSTVGQLLIKLQPLLCGGVGQIRPHNCLPSHTGTAASLRPVKPVADCCSLREPSVRNKQTQWSNGCLIVLPMSLGGGDAKHWMSSLQYVFHLQFLANKSLMRERVIVLINYFYTYKTGYWCS